MRALLAVALLAVAAPAAHADDTFEDKASGAQRIRNIDDIVWPLTATCDQGDDTQNRQCRHLRDVRAAELASATLLVDADAAAFKVGEYDKAKKSVPLALDSCIRCGGVQVDGKTWFVVGQKDGNPAPTWVGKKLDTGPLHANARPFGDPNAAAKYAKAVSSPSVQLLVKLGAKPKQLIENKNVFVLDVLGYRVFTPCDGAVVVSSPHSGTVEVNAATKKTCAQSAPSTQP